MLKSIIQCLFGQCYCSDCSFKNGSVRDHVQSVISLSFISEEWRIELFFQEAAAVSPHTS